MVVNVSQDVGSDMADLNIVNNSPAGLRARERSRTCCGAVLGDKQVNLTLGAEQGGRRRKRLSLPPSSLDSSSAVLAWIERMTLDPCTDVEKLERLMAMYERLKAKEAELAYNAAKGRILKKLAGIRIVKNRPVLSEIRQGKGTFEAFKYAPLEEIDKHLRPLLAEEEMDLSYSDEPCEGGILIRGRLKHLSGGHYEDSFMPAPLDATGGKSIVQAVGAPTLIFAVT